MSVNDSGQIAYVGFLDGLAPAALLWSGSTFSPIAVGSTPGELPGTSLQDVDTLALNNKGEVASRCMVVSPRNCLLFAGADQVPHTLFFDGTATAGVNNVRNFATTRFSLNDNSTILFRADYWNFGSTVNQTGIFTTTPTGLATLAVPAGTKLPGLDAPYTFNTDFGIANDGSVLFSATSGAATALFRLGPDSSIVRVIGTGDRLNGTPVIAIGSVAVGKNGHYAVMANNGTQNLLLFTGDPAKYRQLPINSYTNLFAVSGTGEVIVWCSLSPGYGLYRWDGTRTRTVALQGFPSPLGDPYTQFDSAGITATGDVIIQARTGNDLLLVINAGNDAGHGAGSPPSLIFRTGARVRSRRLTFYNGSTATGQSDDGPVVSHECPGDRRGLVVPRLISGDHTPDGWFFEGNQTFAGMAMAICSSPPTRVFADRRRVVAHFLSTRPTAVEHSFQVVGNTAGIAVGSVEPTRQHSRSSNGAITPLAGWSSGAYRTAAPGGGSFASSHDLGVADDALPSGYRRTDGIFAWTGSAWSSLLRIGDKPMVST